MSDSEDAFASADEGDQPKPSDKKSEPSKQPKGGGKQADKKKADPPTASVKKKAERPTSGEKQSKASGGKQTKSPTKNQKGGKKAQPAKKGGAATPEGDSKDKEEVSLKSAESAKDNTACSSGTSDSTEDKKVEEPVVSQEKSVTETKSADEDLKSENTSEKKETEKKETNESAGREAVPESPAPSETPEETAASPKQEEQVQEKVQQKKDSGGGWSWGSWGTSLMSAATNSVVTFTSQVEEGFNTLVDAVETSMGAPTPEEMAELEKREKAPEESKIERDTTEKDQDQPEPKKAPVKAEDLKEEATGGEDPGEEEGDDWFSSWGLSSVTAGISNLSTVAKKTTNIVQNTGKNLMTGSLDVLETIGKKTFDVIKDHDPGLRKTKEVLFDRGDKPNLSQMLREAKDEAEMKAEVDREFEEARKAHFGSLFDDYQGLAHLEALEILSNQCEKQVQTLLGSMPVETLSAIKGDLVKIKQNFEWDEDEEEDEELAEHDFSKLIIDHLSELHLGTTPDKLNTSQSKIRQNIANFYTKEETGEKTEPKEVHQMAIQALAELTAKSVEQFHKAGELIVLQKDSDKPITERSKSLANLTKVLCTEVSIISTKFTQCLTKLSEDMEDGSAVNTFVTNIYLEAGNSNTYIQDAFQLLLPCLQQSAIQGSLENQS